jgi:hypothetical protein
MISLGIARATSGGFGLSSHRRSHYTRKAVLALLSSFLLLAQFMHLQKMGSAEMRWVHDARLRTAGEPSADYRSESNQIFARDKLGSAQSA